MIAICVICLTAISPFSTVAANQHQTSMEATFTGDLYLFSPIRSTETYLMDSTGVAMYT